MPATPATEVYPTGTLPKGGTRPTIPRPTATRVTGTRPRGTRPIVPRRRRVLNRTAAPDHRTERAEGVAWSPSTGTLSASISRPTAPDCGEAHGPQLS